ncbi:3-oxoadipate enol-lactonase [Tepidamorphus sp. 3E244]|uniref:3-oxoadipate enol-lactonase n=1 Tax=Tepidamorphus sp. 3E244 TaxID=3385498 RepID=UPI0038FCE690
MSPTSPLSFARVNGVNIHHKLFTPPGGGDDGRPVIVLINSLGTDFRIWNTVIEAIENDWRILAYDKRGHGLSQAKPFPYAMDDHVDDLLGLLDHLGIDRVVVAGVSVGGMISLGLLARAPGRVAGAMLCDTGHRIGTRELWDTRIETAMEQGLHPLAQGTLERWFPEPFREQYPEQLVGWRAMLTRTTAAGYAGTSAAIRDADFTEAAGHVAVPVLCITGEHDMATPTELGRELAGLIPGAEFAQVDGAGHLPMIDQSAQLIELMGGFLKKFESGAA